MPELTGKLGTWRLPHVHMWKDRDTRIRASRTPLVSPTTRIATIGSCFAEELANALGDFGLHGGMHPTGLFYNTRSVRQEIERLFGGWPEYDREPPWKTPLGFVHPFKDYRRAFPDLAALEVWSNTLDRRAGELFHSADVVVVTLGLIEAWLSPEFDHAYRQIPHPAIFEDLRPRFHRLTTAEMLDDLTKIRAAIQNHTKATLVLTVSPIPLHSTMTALDVRVANTESKSRIRAVVSEFVERFPDVHYFHSFEIVTTAANPLAFLLEDGRHVHKHGVRYILKEFLHTFGTEELEIPALDTTWLQQPTANAGLPPHPKPWLGKARRWARKLVGTFRGQ